MLRTIGKQSREIVKSVLKKKKATVGRTSRKDRFKPGMKGEGVMVVI